MNNALLYLWLTLLKRRALKFCRDCRRPTKLIGAAAVLFFLGVAFHYRQAEWFGHLVRVEMLIGGALVMMGASLFRGFVQRGLQFDLSDIEFLFTSPFTQRQLVIYNLLPSYLFAGAQSLVFWVLFASHLKHPWIAAICLFLFQLACFHVAAGAALFGGKISEQAHHRIRWMLLILYVVVGGVYLRTAWGLKIVPALASSYVIQPFFSPAFNATHIAASPLAGEWTLRVINTSGLETAWQGPLYLLLFGAIAGVSLALLVRIKADMFESSLATSTRVAQKRIRLQHGHRVEVLEQPQRSARLPKLRWFRGVGAMVWKNLIVAVRSKRELALAAAFTLASIGGLVALRWALRRVMLDGGQLPEREVRDFDKMIVSMLAMLPFFLQRALTFDFRRDGHHLVEFRTLPVSPLALVLAEIAVPTLFCLGFQLLGAAILMFFTQFTVVMLLFLALAFPAVALALNGVWNLHYLLAARRRAGGRPEAPTPVAMLMVVTLSFLVFYPAGWIALQVGRHTFGSWSEPLAFGAWLVAQYGIDLLLVLALARLFQRFELAPDRR